VSVEPRFDGRGRTGDWVIKLRWSDDTSLEGLDQAEWTLQHLDEIQHFGYSDTHGLVFPSVGGNHESHDLLTAWWLVLYCLSMLSRYYPKEWTELLDVDTSPLAVPLEQLITAARSDIPDLISYRLRLLRAMQEEPDG